MMQVHLLSYKHIMMQKFCTFIFTELAFLGWYLRYGFAEYFSETMLEIKKKHPSFSSSINLVSTNSFQNFEGTSISFFLKNGLVSKKFWKTIFEGTVNQTSFSVISGNESRKQKTESKSDTKQQKPMYKLHRQKSEKSKRRNARNLKIESVINFLHFCYTGWIVFSIVLLQTCTSNRSPQWKAITA